MAASVVAGNMGTMWLGAEGSMTKAREEAWRAGTFRTAMPEATGKVKGPPLSAPQ